MVKAKNLDLILVIMRSHWRVSSRGILWCDYTMTYFKGVPWTAVGEQIGVKSRNTGSRVTSWETIVRIQKKNGERGR